MSKLNKVNSDLSGKLIIPDSVTFIGNSAFYECTGLTSITIPDSVTYIGASAFYKCTSLTSIIIPDSVTTIGTSAFQYCNKLTSIIIPNSVTSINSATFENCSNLSSVTIPNNVNSIGSSAFYNCNNLASITIPNSVTSIGDSAFYKCSNLASITIPNSVTSIGEMAFQDCTNLTSITIPNSVTSIGNYAFTLVGNVTYLDGRTRSYGACHVNKYVENNIVYNNSDKTELLFVPRKIKEFTIPDSVTSIGDNAFKECTNLTSITIPNNVNSIGSSAFNECNNLDSITIPNSVTSIGNYAFSYCYNLMSVTIPNSVTSIGNIAFESVGNVTYLDGRTNSYGARCVNKYVENDVVYNSSDKTELLAVSRKLKELTIPNSVTSIGTYAFYNCNNLTSITIPNSVTSIGDGAFDGLPKMPNGNYFYKNKYYENGMLFTGIKDGIEYVDGISSFAKYTGESFYCYDIPISDYNTKYTVIEFTPDYSQDYYFNIHCNNYTVTTITDNISNIKIGNYDYFNGYISDIVKYLNGGVTYYIGIASDSGTDTCWLAVGPDYGGDNSSSSYGSSSSSSYDYGSSSSY